MFKLACIYLLLTGLHAPSWHSNMEEARQIARQEHRHILLNFSGSDWCGPCIMLRKQILDQPVFLQMADSALVLVNADFPRKKKDQLSAQQQQWNNAMADQYDPQGKFPYTLLLDADGKLIKAWEGYPNKSAEEFTDEVRNSMFSDR